MLPQGYFQQLQRQSLTEVVPLGFTSAEYGSERTTVPLSQQTNPPYQASVASAIGQLESVYPSTSSSTSSSGAQPAKQDMTQSTSAEAEVLAHAYSATTAFQGCGYFDNCQDFSAQLQTFPGRSEQNQDQQIHQPHQYHHHQQQQPVWFPVEYYANSVPQGFQQNFAGGSWMAGRHTGNPHSQFPDSPPDSGSEPYSPPNNNPVHPDQHGPGGKVNAVSGTGMMAHPYLNPNIVVSSMSQSNMNLPLQSAMPSSDAVHHHQQQQQHLQHQMPTGMQQHALQGQPFSMSGMATFSLPRPNYNYPGSEPPKLNHPSPQLLLSQINPLSNSVVGANPQKKRKYSDSPPGTLAPGLMAGLSLAGIFPVKPEPCPPDIHYGIPPDCSEDDSYSYDLAGDSGMFLDGTYQVIKWTSHQPNKWATLMDESMKELSSVNYRVDADKGFNYAPSDDAFVCQKKNHFQITVHVSFPGTAKFVKPAEGSVAKIDSFHLHFFGIKMESPSQTIKVEQSQSDRSKKQFHPVKIEIPANQVTKVTVGRLHFSETTSNNMRKKGKPNPDQRYFQLVVALQAHCGENVHMIAAHASERIIVRASNPGQFESDVEACWSKGKTSESIYHAGRVGINTENPDESLTVHGNIHLTGHVISPSDVRAKKSITELDTSEQLRNISQLKVYQFSYNEEFAKYAGLTDDELSDTGVLAQDVGQVLPDAIRETGDIVLPSGQRIDNFLVVNKERIFIENVGAVKELCKVTDKLENRITEIEIINKKLAKLSALRGSFKSICSSISLSACSLGSRSESKSSSSSSSQNKSRVLSVSKHHHHHQRSTSAPRSCCSVDQPPASQAAASGACSSQAIQIIVIVLALIMALCLMSITILYVIDRQNYPQSEASHMLLDSVSSYENKTHVTATGAPAGKLMPGTTPEPLLPPECLLHSQYCSVQCCGSLSPRPQYDPDHGFSQAPDASASKSPKKADKSTKSPNDINYKIGNSVKMSHKVWRHPGLQSMRMNHLLNSDEGQRIKNLPIVMKYHPPATIVSTGTTPMSTTHLVTTILPDSETSVSEANKSSTDFLELSTPRVIEVEENNIPRLFREPVVIENSKHNDFVNDIPNGRMDDYNPVASKDVNMNETVVELYFKQLNSTISNAYCSNSNCRERKGANYSYAIPLSPRFPRLYITVGFKVLISDQAVGVSLCDEKEGTSCSQSEADIERQLIGARKGGIFEWDLPVGYYLSSDYTFRVFIMNQVERSTDVCRQPSASIGTSFAVYHLAFYHVCS